MAANRLDRPVEHDSSESDCETEDFAVETESDRVEKEVILLAEDYIDYIKTVNTGDSAFGDLRRGAWPEFIGDLRTIAKRDEAEKAYDQAREIYESAGEWEFVFAEEEHTRLAVFFHDVRHGLGHEIARDAPERRPLDGPNFVEWLEYNGSDFPPSLTNSKHRVSGQSSE